MRMAAVAHQLEIVMLEIEQTLPAVADAHLGQGIRLALELGVGLLEVVRVQVGVAESVDELGTAVALSR